MAKTPGQKRARRNNKWSLKEYKRRLAIANEEGRPIEKVKEPRHAVYPQHIPAGMFAKANMSDGLDVPVPSEKVVPEDVRYASRDGQGAFREALLAAYGQCAVTGCKVRASLEAAHIIPYVNALSNVLKNGLCLRADIHRLYDRNLITIGDDYVLRVVPALTDTAYAELHLKPIIKPSDVGSWPDSKLLSIRHLFIASADV